VVGMAVELEGLEVRGRVKGPERQTLLEVRGVDRDGLGTEFLNLLCETQWRCRRCIQLRM